MLARPTTTVPAPRSLVPSPQSAATGRCAPRTAKAGLFVCSALHCIYSAFRGFCRSPAATREIFFFPLCCITWLLFSCCCFFPPAFVAVGCGWGQVTGQDVLLLRRYGHANKLHSFQELFRALEGDHLYHQVVSMAPGTVLACATSSPPDPLARGLRGPASLPKCLFRSCLMAQMGVVCTAERLWTRLVCTHRSV